MPGPENIAGVRWRSKSSFILSTVAFCLFTDLFLYALVVPILPFLLQDRLGLPAEDVQPYTSGLLAAYSGASVLFSIPSGWIADRFSSHKPTFLAGWVFLVAGIALFVIGQSFTILLLARILQGMAAAVVWTVGLAIIQDSVGSGKLGQAIGAIFSVVTTGELIAPALGGLLYDATGMDTVFWLSAATLGIELILLLLVVESKTLVAEQTCRAQDHDAESSQANEQTRLLPAIPDDKYKIEGDVGSIFRALPILYCFRETRLLVALGLTAVQGSILGAFDATIPTEAAALFHFSSFKAGLLFTALILPYIGLGPVAGMAADKYGTKLVATYGYALMTPSLALFSIPSRSFLPGVGNLVLFCVILMFNGVSLGIVSSPSFVDASDLTSKYEAANPGFFGDNGPYAQIFGFNSLCFFLGLTLGPLAGGAIRDAYGYEYMGPAFALMSGISAVLAHAYIGQTL
ncbi:major facilitator superfamily domain-containing protein [Fusarium tricinctum]|uniref:Major facilitator superfamily domain-containing protein n=1 Tax=Fusarium tricinctum TaxID=61284 RepID=A0A8K0RWW1_9HYPO|nr:major facilitator superfamily domain-containing protein [Fusarium tricinctum]